MSSLPRPIGKTSLMFSRFYTVGIYTLNVCYQLSHLRLFLIFRKNILAKVKLFLWASKWKGEALFPNWKWSHSFSLLSFLLTRCFKFICFQKQWLFYCIYHGKKAFTPSVLWEICSQYRLRWGRGRQDRTSRANLMRE